MLRTLKFALPLAGMIALGGCGTTGGLSAPTIAQVQAAAVAACSFLPTATTVAQIISAGNPLVTTAGAIAQAICSALATSSVKSSARLHAVQPMVGNVVIHGRFVN